MQLDYISAQDVLSAGGPLSFSFRSLDVIGRRLRLGVITRNINKYIGQDGGIFQQLGKTVSRRVPTPRDVFFLPNKPVTNISAISIIPAKSSVAGESYSLPVDLTPPNQTVYPTGGCSFRYQFAGDYPYPLGLGMGTGRYESVAPFDRDDVVTVTYDCGFPFFVARMAGVSTTLANPLAGGATEATLTSNAGVAYGDMLAIDTGTALEYVTLADVVDLYGSVTAPAIDSDNIVHFPNTPTQVPHSAGAAVVQGDTGLPEEVKMAGLKMLAKEYFMDRDNPAGAMMVRRSGDTLEFARTLSVNVQDLEIVELLEEFQMTVGSGA